MASDGIIFRDIKPAYQWLKSQTVPNTRSLNYSVIIENPNGTILRFDGGGGGAHALIDKKVIIPKEDEILERLRALEIPDDPIEKIPVKNN